MENGAARNTTVGVTPGGRAAEEEEAEAAGEEEGTGGVADAAPAPVAAAMSAPGDPSSRVRAEEADKPPADVDASESFNAKSPVRD